MRVTISEAAVRLGVSPDTVRRRIARGELAAEKEARPQGFVWFVTLPEEAEDRGAQASTGAPPASDEVAALELAHLREMNALLREEVESRRREVSELHVLLQTAQRQLTAGAVASAPEEATEDVPRPAPSSSAASGTGSSASLLRRLLGRS